MRIYWPPTALQVQDGINIKNRCIAETACVRADMHICINILYVYALKHRYIWIMYACLICVPICVTVVQHLLGMCHSPLHSFSDSLKVTSVCNVPKSRATSRQGREHGRTPHLSLIKIRDTVFLLQPHSFQNQRERQLKEEFVSAELILALWLKTLQPNVSGKTPLALSSLLDWPA